LINSAEMEVGCLIRVSRVVYGQVKRQNWTMIPMHLTNRNAPVRSSLFRVLDTLAF